MPLNPPIATGRSMHLEKFEAAAGTLAAKHGNIYLYIYIFIYLYIYIFIIIYIFIFRFILIFIFISIN